MKRIDFIDALIRADRSDADIAEELGCHITTVRKHRISLAAHPDAVGARLLAEELPTGRVRDYDRRRQPVSAEQAAANRAALAEAIGLKPRRTARTAATYPANTRSAA